MQRDRLHNEYGRRQCPGSNYPNVHNYVHIYLSTKRTIQKPAPDKSSSGALKSAKLFCSRRHRIGMMESVWMEKSFLFCLCEKRRSKGTSKRFILFPIREYDPDKADELMAHKAVEKLRAEGAAGFNHILMARCEGKEKADPVHELYERHADLNPIVIYSG